MKRMMILSLFTAAILVVSTTVQADPMVYDGFDYTAGQNLAGQNGGTGWNGSWGGTISNGNSTTIVSPGFTYTDGNSDSLVVIGNKTRIAPGVGKYTYDYRLLDLATINNGKIFGYHDDYDRTVWISYIGQQVTSPSGAPSGGISLCVGTTEHINISYSSDQSPNWLLRRAADNWAATSTPTTTQSFLLVRVDFDVTLGENEDIYMWVNPNLDTEPLTSTADATLSANISFDTIRIGGSSAEFDIDEFRFGNSFADVTPVVPEPSTFVLLGTALLGMLLWRRRRRK